MSTNNNKKAATKKTITLEEKELATKKIISLTVKDRLIIGNLFPKESDLLTQILVRDIIEKTRIDQDEMENIEFRQSGTGFVWDNKKARDFKVEFTKAESKILSDSINDLDKKKKITQELLDLCMKIKNME